MVVVSLAPVVAASVALFLSGDVAAGPRSPHWHRPELPSARPGGSPARIVSLAPVVTETLFLLGRGDRVVGVTRFCDRPPAAAVIAKVGGYVDISLEKVLLLKPDLVIAMPSLGQRELLDRLRERGVPVYVVLGDSLAEVRALVSGIGDVTGAAAAAADVNAALARSTQALADRGKRLQPAKRVAVVVGHDPLVVAGPGTFAAEATALAGQTLATAPDAPMWPVWSPESLASAGVDVLVAAEGAAAATRLRALVERAFPDAARRPRVVAADGAILMRPGPALAEDFAAFATLLEEAAR